MQHYVASGIKYWFGISLPASLVPSGQTIKVNGISSSGTVALNRSGQFKLPPNNQTPDKVLASADRILLLVAHQDDEIVFSPFIGRYCASKVCKMVATINDRGSNTHEWFDSMAKFPVQSDLGSFSGGDPNAHPSSVLQRWNNEAARGGLINLNNVIAREIDRFHPDVILTFDPRHGTSCHAEHRAVEEAVRLGVASYSGSNFPDKSKLYFLTTRRIESLTDSELPYIGLMPIAPLDNTSVTYNADDFISQTKGTGWQFVRTLMLTYPSQFTTATANSVNRTPVLERTTAFQRVTNYSPNDTKIPKHICMTLVSLNAQVGNYFKS